MRFVLGDVVFWMGEMYKHSGCVANVRIQADFE